MNYDKIEETSKSDVKLYEIKHKKVVPFRKITIFVLYHNNQKELMEATESVLTDKNFIVKSDISEFKTFYDERIDVFSEVMYMAVFVSEDFLGDWNLLKILADNYVQNKENKKIIPLIIQGEIYDFIKRENIIKKLQDYIDKVKNEYFVYDFNFNGDIAKEMRMMQKSLVVVKDFLNIALQRDKRSEKNKESWQKIIKYISNDMGIEILDEAEGTKKKSRIREKTEMKTQTEITNNFYGDINGGQIQQGNEYATQNQSVGQDVFDYGKVQKIIEEISKHGSQLEDIYGQDVTKVQAILSEITPMVEQKRNSQKIKKALLTLKEISEGVVGSLIASGIVALISNMNI